MPATQAEIIDAQDWYEREAKGLGARFRDEIESHVQRIATNPLQSPVMLRDVRRARLRRFPYSLFFRMLDDTIYVIACFHCQPRSAHMAGSPLRPLNCLTFSICYFPVAFFPFAAFGTFVGQLTI
jgi:plasmid stabilization system protein ParE